MADPSALVGQTLDGMYRVVRLIGAGGMGAIFEAAHARLPQKRYAVKVLHPGVAADPEVFQRFRREAEITSSLGHDHIVEVHDFNTAPDGTAFLVMEYLDGRDLGVLLQEAGPLPLDMVVAIVGQVASALQAAHAAGVVHRDLKPQNIFLCRRPGRPDFVKVLDFGISKMRDSASILTREHTILGTPYYMSPEQADGSVHDIDERTDIFALGAITWELLTGRMAFHAPTLPGAIYKVVHVDPTDVHVLRPDVPPAVSAVIRIALAKAKGMRYASVAELAEDLVRAAREGVAPARPLPPAGVPATLAGPVVPAPVAPALGTPSPGAVGTGGGPPVPGAVVAPTPIGAAAIPPTAHPGSGPPSTLSSSAGQVAAPRGAPPRRRGLVAGLVVTVLAAGAAVAVVVALGGGPGGDGQAGAGGGGAGGAGGAADPAGSLDAALAALGVVPDAAFAALAASSDAAPATAALAPDAAPATAALAPDAAAPVAVGPPADATPATAATVSITLEIRPRQAARRAAITIDGRAVAGPVLVVPRADAPVVVRVRAPGFRDEELRLVPDADRTVAIGLRASSTGSGGNESVFE